LPEHGNKNLKKERTMKLKAMAAAAMIAATTTAHGQELTAEVLKVERTGQHVILLLAPDNKTDLHFNMTQWSCVLFNKDGPINESEHYVQNVPPQSRVFKRSLQFGTAADPVDRVECRFIEASPKKPGC
jgi:hypothetical protein